MRLALTREISPAIARCELTHLAREHIDIARAHAEHAAYEAALRDLGCTVERLPADESMPDSVFIEDTAVVLDELAIITRPGADSRRAETAAIAARLREVRPLACIQAPGTLDGGDVLVAGRNVFVGVGARTNEIGALQLRDILTPLGFTVRMVHFSGCMHLKSAATCVDDGLLLMNPEWVDAKSFPSFRTITVDPAEPFAANALLVGETLLHGQDYKRTRARLEAAGVRVRPVPAAELAKAEGGVTCCALLVRPSSS